MPEIEITVKDEDGMITYKVKHYLLVAELEDGGGQYNVHGPRSFLALAIAKAQASFYRDLAEQEDNNV